MKKAEVRQLAHGVYRVHWKSGGTSVAAVGNTRKGKKWIAPTNWIVVPTSSRKYWRAIKRMKLIEC